ncbi:MAG: hypothetical protein PQJ46_15070 [Spirochaetales bacterium]|nr:hypothetical protein [Spirochaetales bacterium]
MDLKTWLKTLSVYEQELFFKKAARFFSSRELADIITLVNQGNTLYTAHIRTGVLDRYTVDLENLRRGM